MGRIENDDEPNGRLEAEVVNVTNELEEIAELDPTEGHESVNDEEEFLELETIGILEWSKESRKLTEDGLGIKKDDSVEAPDSI